MSQRPRERTPARQASSDRASAQRAPASRTGAGRPSAGRPSTGRAGAPPPVRRTTERARYVEQKRDPFPYIMGGVVGALVIGLLLAVFLLLNNNTSAPSPITAGGGGQNDATSQPNTNAGEPERMPIEQFKALYDDPANSPVIVDVRSKQSYDEGHIKGAISVPEAEVDSRLADLPKDRLIVAYCQ